ncbi:hypothetical protein HDU67_005831 [Dinochytrium kinnereticum]|nr:hypothetical protein HDU67_005831 [Dinochytrium kinnereticum]
MASRPDESTAIKKLLDRIHSGSNASPQRVKALEDAIEFLSPIERERLSAWVYDRAQRHKPLQYILGSQPFAGLDIAVRPPTLIPRWETEEWTMRLVNQIKTHHDHFNCDMRDDSQTYSAPTSASTKKYPHVGRLKVLDLCTGSGCIAIALAHHLGQPVSSSHSAQPFPFNLPLSTIPSATEDEMIKKGAIPATVIGVDVSKRSLQLARVNARKCHIPDTSSVLFFEKDIMEPPPPSSSKGRWSALGVNTCLRQPVKFDIIVSNPPYIPPKEYANLDASVKNWEDPQALVTTTLPSSQGTEFHARILEIAGEVLDKDVEFPKDVPRIVMEVSAGDSFEGGKTQADLVEGLMRKAGFGRTEQWMDLAGKARAVVGYDLS